MRADSSPAIVGWPTPLVEHLRSYGDPVAVADLGGMSLGGVWRVRFATGSVVVKTSPSDTELVFYETLARQLNEEIGVSTPRLEWSGSFSGSHWLVLEEIPDSLPRTPGDRWRVDARVLETLLRLHHTSLDQLSSPPSPFRPRWTEDMNAAALTLLSPDDTSAISRILASLRRESQSIFAPRCFIAGDPNPANWGVREDGTVALFDWERFGYGTPACDLAIIIPGLGDGAIYQHVAGHYCDLWSRITGTRPWSARELARDISIAKVWTVVEFMANHIEGNATSSGKVVDWLVSAVPPWLDEVATGF